MAKHHLKLISLSLVILGVAFLSFAFVYDSPPKIPAVHSLRSWQEADTPPGYPVDVTEDGPGRVPEFDPRFLLLDAIERFSIPRTAALSSPLGPQSGVLVETVAEFGSEVDGELLLGDQLIAPGEGEDGTPVPVHAAGDGLVLYAGEAGPEWGHVVVLGHRLPDGRLVQSVYGFLDRIDVPRGDVVARGKVIGRVDRTPGEHPAPLHFEFRESDGLELGSLSAATRQNRLDPGAVLNHHQLTGEAVVAPSALTFRDPPFWEGTIQSRQSPSPRALETD